MRVRPRIRTVLLVVNVIILLLPVAGVAILRIYDNELIRQTEASLLGQAAALRATYLRVLYSNLPPTARTSYGLEREARSVTPPGYGAGDLPPLLDVTRDAVQPSAEAARSWSGERDERSIQAGQNMTAIVEEVAEATGSSVLLVNHKGHVVSSSSPAILGKSVAHRPEVQRVLTGEVVRHMQQLPTSDDASLWESLSGRGKVLVVVALPVVWSPDYGDSATDRVYGAIVASRAPLSLTDAMARNSNVLAGLFAVLVIAVSLITLLTTLTIQRPIRQLRAQTRRIAASAASARPIESPGVREFEELSESIAQMAKTLEERNEYIRSFARNVSHEFKTPLASIRGSVELLEDHFETMTPDKRADFLAIIGRDTERLDRLVRRLLELARADVFNPTTEWVNGRELFQQLAERSQVELQIVGDLGDLPIAMAPDAFESVFTNLFDNAAKHGGGKVKLEIVDRGTYYFQILLTDQGPGISEANRDKVFESFFTTARDVGGTGLGLSIVRSMLQRHGGDIRITESESGAAFLLKVPRSL